MGEWWDGGGLVGELFGPPPVLSLTAYPHISYITAMRAQVGVSGSDVPQGPSFVDLS